MAKQYISVSGVTRNEDMEALEQAFKPEDNVNLLLGVQATYKTQFQKVENSRGRLWHPVGDEIWQSFRPSSRKIARRVIHYSYPSSLGLAQVQEATAELLQRMPADSLVDGWQFNNLNWDKLDYSELIESLVSSLGPEFIIAQLSKQVMERSSPKELAKRIAGHGIAHVLLDTSGGMGQDFDCDQYRRYIDSLIEFAPQVHIGIAGGLGPDSLSEYFNLLAQYPSLSCDAESKLRKFKSGAELSSSVFDLQSAATFIEQSRLQIFEAQNNFQLWWQNIGDQLPPGQSEQVTKLHLDYWPIFMKSPGSSHNHQAWEGGYIEHISQVVNIAKELYQATFTNSGLADLEVSGEHFTLADAVLILVVHDLEKPFKSSGLAKLSTKHEREMFKKDLLLRYGVNLSPAQMSGLDHVEGFKDDYRSDRRVMTPLGAFVHACDLLSARFSYNVGNPRDSRAML